MVRRLDNYDTNGKRRTAQEEGTDLHTLRGSVYSGKPPKGLSECEKIDPWFSLDGREMGK